MFRLILACLLSFGAVQVHAEEPIAPMVGIPANTVHKGDYFVTSNNVEISGVVEGDVYVLATQVIVDGHITGDLLLGAVNAEISGHIDHNIRMIAGQTLISGSVGGNVTALSGNIHLAPAARVHGNLVCVGGSIEAGCNVGGETTITASSLRLSGVFGDSVTAYVGSMRVTSKASIKKNLAYRSDTTYIDPDAKIGGELTHYPSFVHKVLKDGWIQKLLVGSKLAAIAMNFLYSFVVGWILLKLFPGNVQAALEALSQSPIKAFGYGLMLLILLPLASLILLMTVLGAPFALTLIALNVMGFYTAKVFSILWVSEEFFKKCGWNARRTTSLAIGLLIYFLLVPIPYFGFILTLAVLIFGLGAGAAAGLRKRF